MRSADIVGRIQNLSRIADITGEAYRQSLQELKSHVHKLLGITKTSPGISNGLISIDDLRRKYVGEQMSLSDLAHHFNCTRQYIHKLLKQHDIERRDMSAARILALNKGKLSFTRIDDSGNESQVILQKININKKFFKTWSPEMAYVLGVIYTDGNLIPSSRRDSTYKSSASRFSVSQSEPELLEKVLALMDCDAKIYRGKQRLTGNPLYQFSVNNEEIYDDLLKLGLTPRKSLTLGFPDIPSVYVRHFIRGCWDGDGSVYLTEFDLNEPNASFLSGSRAFADGILRALTSLGLPETRLNSYRRIFQFRYRGPAVCTKLYHVLYDGVPESMCLSRKFELFREIAQSWEGRQARPFVSGSPSFASRTLAFPGNLTRTDIARLLGISLGQVTLIMDSPTIRLKLEDFIASSDEETLREIKDEVAQILRSNASNNRLPNEIADSEKD